MAKIDLIAIDLDGTLLMPDHGTVSVENINALTKASEKGVKIVLASGRTMHLLEDVYNQLPCVTHFILANGVSAVKVGQERKVLFYQGMSEELWRPIFNELSEENVSFEVYHNGRSYMEKTAMDKFAEKEHLRPLYEKIKDFIIPIENLSGFLEGKEIEKFHAFDFPKGNYEKLFDYFSNRTDISATRSFVYNFEINSVSADKGKGLEKLCQVLGINRENVMAIGDAGNDIPMLKWAGLSVAMENAHEEAKNEADFITLSNLEHGVAHAVNKFVLCE